MLLGGKGSNAMMIKNHPEIEIREEDTKRLRAAFSDNRLLFGFNHKRKVFQAWYKPNGPAYLACTCDNVCHAIRLLRHRLKYEQMRAKDLVREIDDFNEELLEKKDAEAVHEFRHDLMNIMKGRQIFAPRRRAV
jgi:hypothetical protein